MAAQGSTTIIGRTRLRRQRVVSWVNYDFETGGASRIHGHTDIGLILPLLFLTIVIFMTDLCDEKMC